MAKNKSRLLREDEQIGNNIIKIKLPTATTTTTQEPSTKPNSPFFSPKLTLILISSVTILVWFLLYSKIVENYINDYTNERYWYALRPSPCSHDKEILRDMSKLAVDASSALSSLGSNPVACYGTLLGVLRIGAVLPWDNNVNVCIVGRLPHSINSIQDAFSIFRIVVDSYDSWNGYYRIRRNNLQGFVTVFDDCTFLDRIRFHEETDPYLVEEGELKWDDIKNTSESSISSEERDDINEDKNNNKSLCPDGRLPYVAQLLQRYTKPIPSEYFKPPFQSLPFGRRSDNMTIAVPNGDLNTVKYFYPKTWWRVVKPVGC